MSMASLDTYIAEEISDKFHQIISTEYIVREILKEIDTPARERFIKTYVGVGEPGREVPVVYSFPEEKMIQKYGSIYVGIRDGTETSQVISNLQGHHTFSAGVRKSEEVVVTYDESIGRYTFETIHPIGQVEASPGITMEVVETQGNKGIFEAVSRKPILEGYLLSIDYITNEGEADTEDVGEYKGFSMEENVSVLPMCTNMDVVRCFDLIIRAIVIMIREGHKEQTTYQLSQLRVGEVEPMDIGSGTQPELLFGREIRLTYHTQYTLSFKLLESLEELYVEGAVKHDEGK